MEPKRRKIIIFVLLFLICISSLALRIVPPWKIVFSSPIKYSADDGVYHMRIVENLLLGHIFPKWFYFDAYTYFPYGTFIHFAPLYDWFLSALIWLFSFGKPTIEIINKIAPFYPPILGTLTILIAYFIGKELWNERTGLLAAFIFSLFPPFLFRSLLGQTDHHQAEVLFSSLAILFFILLFKKDKESNNKKQFWVFSILTGISLGLYFLVWTGALLFLLIVFISLIWYAFLKFFKNQNSQRILTSGIIIFGIIFLMIIPFLGHPDIFHSPLYNIKHLGSLGLGIIILGLLKLLFWWFEKRNYKIKKDLFLLNICIILLLVFLILINIFPLLGQEIIKALEWVKIGMVPNKLAPQLIGEMRPLGLSGAFSAFGGFFFLSLIGIGILLWELIRDYKNNQAIKGEMWLNIIWFFVILLVTGIFITSFGQNRFAYYFSLNIALISSFLITKTIKFAQEIFKNSKINPNLRFYFLGSYFALWFGLLVFIFYPFPFNLILPFPNNIPLLFINAFSAAKYGAVVQPSDYYETMAWLKTHTPEVGLPFYSKYQEPKYDYSKGQIEPYNYPTSSYGIMSSWDIGHMITYYAHRIPNANPFQEGVGNIDTNLNLIFPGESTFFIASDETIANQILNQLKSRYVITTYGDSISSGGFLSKVEWAQNNSNNYYLKNNNQTMTTRLYDKSMAVRLHLLDGREWEYQNKPESYIQYLDHYRLIYESSTTIANSLFNNSDNSNDNIKLVKIFEYVKGAIIKGKVPKGAEVEISTLITTNQNRQFVYKKTMIAQDGTFSFVVPYSTLGKKGWLNNSTKFEVFAQPYKLNINGIFQKEINITEDEIMNNKTINL